MYVVVVVVAKPQDIFIIYIFRFFFREFTCPLCSKVIFFRVHVGDGGCFGSSKAECFLFLRNLNFPALFLMMMRDDSYLDLRQIKRLWIILDNFPHFYYSLSSLAILDAISLKPIEVPDILLNRTPFKDNRGNLHTSISH